MRLIMTEAMAPTFMVRKPARSLPMSAATLAVLVAILVVELCRLLAMAPTVRHETIEPVEATTTVAPIDVSAHAFVDVGNEPTSARRSAPARRVARKVATRDVGVPSTRDEVARADDVPSTRDL